MAGVEGRMLLPWLFFAVLGGLVVVALFAQRAHGRRAERQLAEGLRFEELLAELSARLIAVAPADVDAAIRTGLERVARFLRMDRASLGECAPGGLVLRLSWVAEGVAGAPPLPSAEQFPWTAGALERGAVVRLSRVDALPAEAAGERQAYLAAGTRSYAAVPLSAGGAMLGVVAFDAVHGEQIVHDALVRRLELLGDVFAGALERARQEGLLAERLRFETLLSEQSAMFSSVAGAEIDGEIERALRRIADFFKADWGRLAEVSCDTREARITHSWVADSAAPRPSAVPLAGVPWVMGRLRAGEVVRFSCVDDLPEDGAAVDRRTYRGLGIKSHVELPLQVGGSLLGALAFSTLGTERVWPDDLIMRLRLLGEVFGSILSRRQSEMEAQRLRRDLSHVGRVSTIGELTASLAHQLNQPLAAILSNAQTAYDALEAGAVDLAEIRAILADIIEDDRRAGEVIGRLRGLLKKGNPEFTDLDINELVGEVARLVSGDAILRNVVVRLDLGPGLPQVWGDRVQLQQVVLNLVINGLDALRDSPAGERTLELSTTPDGPTGIRVAVHDSGPGIDDADLDHVFEPFYTTKADGLGMGLAIARSIVDAHGGRLAAGNDPKGGATVSFTVPGRSHP